MNRSTKSVIFTFALLLVVFSWVPLYAAQTPEELKKAINEKTKNLEEINNQLKAVGKAFQDTQNLGKSLKKEITQIDTSIKQLNLQIKASEINVQKINLELDSLEYKISETEAQIGNKKDAVGNIVRQMNESDHENFLITMLKNKSLSASVVELQSLMDLSENLSTDLSTLQHLRTELSEYLGETTSKKSELEFENKNFKNRKTIVQTQKSNRTKILEQTKSQEKVYQDLLSDLEKQQDQMADEIAKIEEELRARFDESVLPSKRPGLLGWPVKTRDLGGVGILTQHFGERSYLYKGKPHNGLDIGIPVGTPVYAAEDGKVMAVDDNDRSRFKKYQYGEYVLIGHPNNLATLYAHLESAIVRKGDQVKRGDLIGYSGNSGYSTGPHVHFGVYWASSILMKSIPPAAGLVPVGVILNPEDYL